MSEKLNLKNVTLFCYENRPEYIEKAIESVEICNFYADFGDIKFVTNKQIDYEHCVVDEFPIKTLTDYSKFILTKLNGYVEKDYVLICQSDGHITNPQFWTNEFFNYDYLGANILNMPLSNGKFPLNGGCSLRSKRLLNVVEQIVKHFGFPSKELYLINEDVIITICMRNYLEKIGMKFPSVELANQFSAETLGVWENSFAMHGPHWFKNFDQWKNPLKYK